jgi:hypothetical protein
MSASNNNNNNNNNGFGNHFALLGSFSASRKATPIHRATAPAARTSPPVASSNISPTRASDSSGNSAPAMCTSGYICRGWISLLPKADKLRKAASYGPSSAHVVCTTPKDHQEI